MKVGSMVECVDAKNTWQTKPLIKGQHYTVREIRAYPLEQRYSILLEEITNEISPTGREWAYKIERFREIEFPSIEETIKECLTRELIHASGGNGPRIGEGFKF